MEGLAEAAFDELIGGEEFALEVAREEDEADYDAADEVAEDDLEEAEVACVGEAGDADDGEGAGLSGDERERDGPPGDVAAAEEVGAERAVFLAEAQTEESDADEVGGDDEQVRQAQARDGESDGEQRGVQGQVTASRARIGAKDMITAMRYFLALDAGGTKTDALLADEKRVLARASTGTIKLLRTSEAEAEKRLRELLMELAAKAGVGLEQIVSTCAGVSGVTVEAVREWSQSTLERLVGGTVLVVGDEEIGLDAAFAGGRGILMIAGTGSNVIGRAADGTMHHAGGWGPGIGDEGSGYWIGREAVRCALHALDRGVKSLLLEAVQDAWGVSSLSELVGKGNERPGPDFAALTHTVAECAERGDAVAADVLRRAGEELAEFVEVVCAKLGAEDSAMGVAYTGSVIENIAAVRDAMKARLARSQPKLRVVDGAVDSLEGALWRARCSAGTH